MAIDLNLRQWATRRQAEIIEAVHRTGSRCRAAKELKTNQSYVSKAIKAVEKRAAMQGYAPEAHMTKVVPEPFVVRGTSTLFDEEGKAKLQWVKTRLDDAQVEVAMRAAIEALACEIKREKPIAAPKSGTARELLTLYTLTDCHVGAKAWGKECGEDWDLDIAEKTLTSAMRHLITTSPDAETAVVNQLGDFLHTDGLTAVTPTSGHQLDADSRFEKVVQVAVRILRATITAALGKHKRVVVLMAEGNHDIASSVWLRHLFALLYENEPRVSVIDSPLPYYVHQHGRTLLAFHHGHLSKNDSLPLLFAAQFPKLWGETTRRYCHTGHRHHVEEKEHNGMIVTQHPTMAARDAYAARGGWIADRSMTSITYHAKHGQVARNTVVPEMLS